MATKAATAASDVGKATIDRGESALTKPPDVMRSNGAMWVVAAPTSGTSSMIRAGLMA
jgi:hypothetical protein